MIEKIKTHIKDVIMLSKQKEDETTWSKIDSLFTKMNDLLNTVEGVKYFLQYSLDLLIRSISSDRSKLNGSSLVLTRKIVDICKDETPSLSLILSTVLKVCGRSNKVVYTRAQETFVHICFKINILPYSKLFNEYCSSTNKNIRLSVFKGIFTKTDAKHFEKLIVKGKNDPSIEVRSICKKDVNVEVVPETAKIEYKHSYPPFSSRTVAQKVIEIKKVEECIKEKMEVSHSPMKKLFKFERKKENKDCDKIEELENQVKSITNECKDTKGRSRVQSIINSYNSKAFLQSLAKKEVEPAKKLDEDLTPKKLDKFLSKYRMVYGNLGEKKENDEENKKEKEMISEKAVNEGKGQICLSYTENNEKQIEILDAEISKEKIILGESNLCKEDSHEMDDISKDFSNLSLVEEEKVNDYQDSSCVADNTLKYDYTIFNSEEPIPECEGEIKFKDTQIETKELFIAHKVDEMKESYPSECTDDIETIEQEKKNVINFYQNQEDKDEEKDEVLDFNNIEASEKSSSNEEHVQIQKVNSDNNRFSSLLYSDKDECVIFDINKESPSFKLIDKDETSPLSKAVIQTEISSSFLYSKEQESNKCLDNRTSDNFTMIDSTTCIDKNTFNRKK